MSKKVKHTLTKKHEAQAAASGSPQTLQEKNPILAVSIRFLALLMVLLVALVITDKRKYFEADNRNNHTIRKWNSLYRLTEQHNMDILLIGNSHLYTGINPKNLSTAMGANAFILAAPGTSIADSYFGLLEALELCKPSLVVVETYGINDFDPYELTGADLSDQFKSFSTRRNVGIKLKSTPKLFSFDEYIYAWSNTIRNHDYLLTNMEQIRRNIKKQNDPDTNREDELYLGRFIRFTTGLEEDILTRYREEGPRVDGKEYTYSSYAELYVDKLVNLCKKEGIELIFLTLPMYYQHIADYDVWRDKLAEILDRYPNKWINLQSPYDFDKYTPIAFENTYNSNQHMTYQGSLMATYDLAEFIRDELDLSLPERYKDVSWHRLFYGQEGYFENFRPVPEDPYNKLLAENVRLVNTELAELQLLTNNRESRKILAKVDRSVFSDVDPDSCRLDLIVTYKQGDAVLETPVTLQYDKLHKPFDRALFFQNISPVDITGVAGGALNCN